MRLRLERATRIPRPPPWAVAVVALWVGLVLWASGSFFGTRANGPLCHVRRLTGVPCPTCGGSRGARAILDGDPGTAFDLNPVFFGVLAVGGVLLLSRLLTARRLRFDLTRRERVLAWIAAAATFAGGWAYVIWRQG